MKVLKEDVTSMAASYGHPLGLLLLSFKVLACCLALITNTHTLLHAFCACCVQTDVHSVPPPGTTCVLCHAPEAPGSHMDQAKALRSSGLSNRGLGPLMPVCMPPAKPAGSGSKGEPHPASEVQQHQVDAEGAPAVVAAAAPGAGEAATAAPAASAPAAESQVVWVHRQCALWSPEVYPDKTGMLVSTKPGVNHGVGVSVTTFRLLASAETSMRTCKRSWFRFGRALGTDRQ